MKLKGKTAIITGSSGRLGAAIGIGLAGAGCDCICHYNSNKQKAEMLVEQIKAAGQKAIAIKADLTKPEQIEKLFAATEKFATPQILIN
ncbi:MAG: SDR family NAD(P)-dependent oxidoreductase, partial [Planctomycetes bacterium]|nr:SDR family NAD(P)-dependent oxidoreductase [Planctomycetota bacterium]